jgi:hypothetical protein
MVRRTVSVGIVALASVAGVAGGIPTVWSPLNLLGVIPALMLSGLLGGAAIAVPAVCFAAAFAWWCRPLWRDEAVVPTRSFVLAGAAVVLSAANIFFGWNYGLKYQGAGYVRGVTTVSVVSWTVVTAAAVLAARRPSVKGNLGFHLLLFGWLGWYAIPYMGELP